MLVSKKGDSERVPGSYDELSSHKRVRLPDSEEDLAKVSKDDILSLWKIQDLYIDQLEAAIKENGVLRRAADATQREHLLVVRLATKDQEIQDLSNQISELKAAQAPSIVSMRNTLMDPAVNLIVQKLKKELSATKVKMQETQEELNAWKFTPDSVTGKRLMFKCRQLLQENEDIGKMISSGRLAKLEEELALQKNLCEEMKKNQAEMEDFVQEFDEDVEGMQSTIYFLQQQLKEAKETISQLQADVKQECPVPAKPTITDKNDPNNGKASCQAQPVLASDSDQPVPAEEAKSEESIEREVSHNVEDDEGDNQGVATSRTTRRGRSTPTTSLRDSPIKHSGRITRGQKRGLDGAQSKSTVVREESRGRGRPKRRRAAPHRLSDEGRRSRKSESEHHTEIDDSSAINDNNVVFNNPDSDEV